MPAPRGFSEAAQAPHLNKLQIEGNSGVIEGAKAQPPEWQGGFHFTSKLSRALPSGSFAGSTSQVTVNP